MAVAIELIDRYSDTPLEIEAINQQNDEFGKNHFFNPP